MPKKEDLESKKILDKEIQFISFKLTNEEFGVNIDRIKEILKIVDITPVPRAPEYFMGIMNLRGTIVPVLDLKKRIGLESSSATTDTRILVISFNDNLYGIIVDEVSEVQRVKESEIDPPPQATKGIDKFYLEGVVKNKEDNSLVMMLNLVEVLNIEIMNKRAAGSEASYSLTEEKGTEEMIDEEQLVTFNLGSEEFGIDISAIKEILRVSEITSVPNVPDYVIGIQNVRGAILPIIDMRQIVSMDAQGSTFDLVKSDVKNYIDQMSECLSSQEKSVEPKTVNAVTEFKKKIQNVSEVSHEGRELGKFILPGITEILEKVAKLGKMSASDDEKEKYFDTEIKRAFNQVYDKFSQADQSVDRLIRRDQRILIIEVNNTTVGIMVDRVSEVMRLNRKIIDTTPSIIATYGKEIKGVAKLNEGTRLIMILNEGLIISSDEAEVLSKIHEDEAVSEKTEKKDISESQFVIFSIFNEEFGVGIDKVREIFKVSEITSVPKSPAFIRGVTNLRGNIIPVVDVRKRFGLTDVVTEYKRIIEDFRSVYEKQRNDFNKMAEEKRYDALKKYVTDIRDVDIFKDHKSNNDAIIAGVDNFRTDYEDYLEKLYHISDLFFTDEARAQEEYRVFCEKELKDFEKKFDRIINGRSIELEAAEKILVVTLKDIVVGLLVDSVHEVLRIADSLVDSAPSLMVSNVDLSYLEGIAKLDEGKRIILLLNTTDIMSEKEYKKLAKLKSDSSDNKKEKEIKDTVKKSAKKPEARKKQDTEKKVKKIRKFKIEE